MLDQGFDWWMLLAAVRLSWKGSCQRPLRYRLLDEIPAVFSAERWCCEGQQADQVVLDRRMDSVS